MQYRRLTGRIMSLSLLLMILVSCRDRQAEEQIKADAQIQIAAQQAQAQRDISYNAASAEAAVAASQKEATIAVSKNQLEAERYKAEQATKQAGIWADKLPLVATIAAFALLAAIVLIYRGKIGLRRVDKEVLLLSSPLSVAPSRTLSSRPLPSPRPPPQVTAEAQKLNALVAPGDVLGVWVLTMPDGRRLTMRPKQLTDSQR